MPAHQDTRSLFIAYAHAGFTSELLPILPPGGVMSSSSRHAEALAKSRGKIPAKRLDDGWVGFRAWSTYEATPADIERWAGWDCGAGLQGRRYPGVDIDVNEGTLAGRIEQLAIRVLGAAPARFGRGERRLLPYQANGLRKRRLVFRPAAGRDVQAVELLATGQQYVIEGIHPKTGAPYSWRDGISPATLGADGLWPITVEDVDRFFNELEALLLAEGCELVGGEDSSRTSDAAVWSESLLEPAEGAVARALAAIPNEADYDDWFRMMAAVRAACGPEGYDTFAEWSASSGKDVAEITLAKWESLRPPFAVGWPYIADLAKLSGFNVAAEEFGPVPDETDEEARARAEASWDMFERCCWVEGVELVADLATKELLTRQQFNARFWQVGDPADSKKCAWAVFLRSGDRRRSVRSLTYRPGGELFVSEPGLGRCVNVWWPSDENLPDTATDEDARPWLDHMAYLVPNATERMHLLDWLAWVVQNPGEKPNWGVLLGSPAHGIGKSLMLEPLRAALGRHNVREIGPSELSSGYSGWLAETKVFVVEEMHSFERRETMNRLKHLLAAPPWRLQINPKFGKQYEIPNIVAGVFFTNHENALALERGDRRFFVLWTEVLPRDEAYYRELTRWFKAGGAAAAGRWLLNRDVSQFNAHGRAPETTAKLEMEERGRHPAEEWVAERIAQRVAPFDTDIVLLAHVWDALPAEFFARGMKPNRKRVSDMLKAAGCVRLARHAFGRPPADYKGRPIDPKQASVWSVRDHHLYARAADLTAEFFTQWRRAQAAYEGFHDVPPEGHA